MQRSIIERVFPKPKGSLLPQYDESSPSYHDEEHSTTSTPSRIRLDNNTLGPSTPRSSRRSSHGSQSQSQSRSQLQPAPLSASIVHHDDPFLAVDRAAANLQRTIQALLDFQGEALSGRHRAEADGESTPRSSSPSQSRTGYSTSTHDFATLSPAAVPVRQPKQKRKTLRGTRRGLVQSMQEFAALKQQELKITQDETAHRQTALEKASALETKREAVQHEIRTLQERATGNEANTLRTEAQSIEQEIHELEGRLMELKARHRHLTDRAAQLENSAASELSSYEGTLALINKETTLFLRRPPVKRTLSSRNLTQHERGQDMYALRPERRTLDLAKDQWEAELGLLEAHRSDTERERQALLHGAEVWKDVIQTIDQFEHNLRTKVKAGHPDSAPEIIHDLDTTIHFLQEKLSQAELQDWKLLICAIGAELEAFHQAKSLLAPDQIPPANTGHGMNDTCTHQPHADDDDSNVPPADLLGAQSPELTSAHLAISRPEQHNLSDPTEIEDTNSVHNGNNRNTSSSNESLRATLHAFPPSTSLSASTPAAGDTKNRDHKRTSSSSAAKQLPARRSTRFSESEDDEPGPDFLVSH